MNAFLAFLTIFLVGLMIAVAHSFKLAYDRWSLMEHGYGVYVLKPGCETPMCLDDYVPAKIVNYATTIGERESKWVKAYCADDLSYHRFTYWDVYNLRVITQEQYEYLDELLGSI